MYQMLYVGCLLVACSAVHAHEGDAPAPTGRGWRIGTARADITPEKPLWMAGYAARNKPAEGVLHPLWIKALALEDAAGNRAVLLTSDLIGFPRDLSDGLCARLAEACQLPRAAIILSASHTHSGPVIKHSLRGIYFLTEEQMQDIQDYTAQLEDRLVRTVVEAFAALAPATLEAGSGIARIAVNRRNNTERDLAPESTLQGPQDHSVPVLVARSLDGAPRAVVFGYACHATVLDGYQWCGDYPGFAQIALEQAYPGMTAMFFAGCGADQNPLPRRSIALARQYGATLAAAVERAVEDTLRPLAPALRAAYEQTALPMEPPPSRDEVSRMIEESSGYQRQCLEILRDRMDRGETIPDTYPYPVQCWRMGDQTLFTLGGEVTVEYALNIKARIDGRAFVMGYANDVMAYIPSVKVLTEGGYEGRNAQMLYGLSGAWLPALEEQILATAERLLQDCSR